MSSASGGWTRYVVTSRVGEGRDLTITDPDTGDVRFLVDGRMGMRPKAHVQSADGLTVYRLRGSMLGVPKTMDITDASGAEVGSITATFFSPIAVRISMGTSDGRSWELAGSFLEREYGATADGEAALRVSRTVGQRDTVALEVADGVDPALGCAVMWAVDRFVEQR